VGPLEWPNEWSVIAAPRRDQEPPSDEIVTFALRAIECARGVKLKSFSERHPEALDRLDRISGQHYRILAALAETWGVRRIVEVGTFRGSSALALLEAPNVESLITYDLVSWEKIDGTWLRADDFDGRLEQRLLDLADPKTFAAEADVLRRADLVFVDASKDGVFEPTFLPRLLGLHAAGPQLVVLDDIRVLTMIRLWHSITFDKLDLTSFGHWSGTGIIARGGFPPDSRPT
jgi:predicted O-methyltransferase YrrM